MTYAFYYDAPGNPAIYQLVGREIGDQEPDGMVLQVVTATDAGLRHLNVWQSREQWEAFREGTVRPAVRAVLERLGIPAPESAPEEHALDLVDIGGLGR
jgi:hypothetical protein